MMAFSESKGAATIHDLSTLILRTIHQPQSTRYLNKYLFVIQHTCTHSHPLQSRNLTLTWKSISIIGHSCHNIKKCPHNHTRFESRWCQFGWPLNSFSYVIDSLRECLLSLTFLQHANARCSYSQCWLFVFLIQENEKTNDKRKWLWRCGFRKQRYLKFFPL